MADSDNAVNLPVGMDLYAAYVDGNAVAGQSGSYAAACARFGSDKCVSISVDGNKADVGDVERGALTIQQAISKGYGSVYCSASNWVACQDAYIAAKKPQPQWWVAGYGTPPDPTIPKGAIAHQYTDGTGAYDTSVVMDFWPGIDKSEDTDLLKFVVFSAPIVNPQPGQTKGEIAQFLSDGMRFHWIESPGELTDLTQGTVPYFSGTALEYWANDTPVADPRAFGRPSNAVTAVMLSIPFP